MKMKCESCRHFGLSRPKGDARNGLCRNENVIREGALFETSYFLPISPAREICDKEGDGHFVYFEPKTPAAGAFVQITRQPADRPWALSAAAGTRS